ncbi:hypothetical protein DFR70_13317 [Nocardia tenerifensis]|uniref:Uncharacterized protein n=1 Tax=Nocardia tenerifensis TaxID=228006 RepID=A0A318JQD6_9NOCA|nr:hypothetical protein [Nocardia tenerifensis]PXX52285.1 hypothetical protein DFR70_13317 [Nocardia tenerifensis]
MSRSTDDGEHEGWILYLFADGAGGGGFDRGRMPVLYTPDGEPRDYGLGEPRELRDFDEVVAWQMACVEEGTDRIHWRGPRWTRVEPAENENLAARCARLDKFADPSAEVEDAVYADWYAHIRPAVAVSPVRQAAAEVAAAQAKLTDAVRQARIDGASWADIGTATGMTRQSAHERWSKLVADIPSPQHSRSGWPVEIGPGQPQPCGRPAAYRVEGYSARDGQLHGSLDAIVYACAEHHDAARSDWLEGLAPHSSSRSDSDIEMACGYSVDYRKMSSPKQ